MARRLHINKSKGKIHGGIFATRLVAHIEVEIRLHDYPLTKVYLDRAALEHHHFIARDYPNIPIPYNLVFSIETRDIIPLPAPDLFDPVTRADIGLCLRTSSPTGTLRLLQRQRRSLDSGMSGCPLLSTPTTIHSTDRLPS